MTRRYAEAGALSVATCRCGGFTRALPVCQRRRMDRLIRAHWLAVVTASRTAGGAAEKTR